LLIALAGPAVNVAIVLGLAVAQWLALGLAPWADELTLLPAGFLNTLMAVNLVLALFNLIPAFPMDGGRVLRALLSGWLGRLRATEIAATLGQALALIFGVYCLLHGALIYVFLAGFLFLAAPAELSHARGERERRGRDGTWTAPRGYRWVSRGPGLWQLAPIVIPASDRSWRS